MITNEFKGKLLSALGFGTMRLPLNADGTIDETMVREMTDYALKHGINYFDTAYPYHGGWSENVIGKILAEYPRESFYLASKYPGHQIAEKYDPAATFEEQLKKCQVDYFDFYLLHNVYEKSIETYLDPELRIVDYFLEQRRLGRIRHLGFSTHADIECLQRFLDIYGDEMEFCQIQMNYLDMTLQNAKQKYDILTERNIPVWVMEPLRGGKLATLSEEATQRLTTHRPGVSAVEWSFRYLLGHENVKMILSGMSTFDQMKDNIRIFETSAPLNASEEQTLMEIAEGLKRSVPCTGCRYCTDGCPMELNIPLLLAKWNDFNYAKSPNVTMTIESLPEDKRPSACVACGACMTVCPQKIEIPVELKKFSDQIATMPKWADVCREREAAAKRVRES